MIGKLKIFLFNLGLIGINTNCVTERNFLRFEWLKKKLVKWNYKLTKNWIKNIMNGSCLTKIVL
jgi:hypothetical protein